MSTWHSKHAGTQVCMQGSASAMCHRVCFSCGHLPHPLVVIQLEEPTGFVTVGLVWHRGQGHLSDNKIASLL